MKGKQIIQLNQEIIGKIAAGEVVERPGAAIKELVENSIDAGATSITVEIKNGGISYFRVTDNGAGIAPGDIKMAFERHATSKIRSAEDLGHIETLGFRGEALASICAVSKVTCNTRQKGKDSGICAVNVGGVFEDIRDAACPEGTSLVVKDLFYNTPVRLKFLKKPSYEAGLVSDLMMRLIFSHPEIAFRFINDGKTIYHSVGDNKLQSAIYSVYGKQTMQSMREVDGMMNGLMIRGYVGIGDSARGNRNHQSFFINGRYLKSQLLSDALEAACKERVTIGHFPTCVLHVEMPFDLLDVNVHPNKLEVRFQNERNVFDAVETIIKEKLSQDTPLTHIPSFSIKAEDNAQVEVKNTPKIPTLVYNDLFADSGQNAFEEGAGLIAALHQANKVKNSQENLETHYQYPKSVPDSAEKTVVFKQPPPIEEPKTENRPITQSVLVPAQDIKQETMLEPKPVLSIIGTYLNTYILAQYDNSLLLIDQHAVHERLLFDKMMQAYDTNNASQTLLIPQSVSLSFKEMGIYQENIKALAMAGFETENFGERTIQIRAVPMVLGEPQLTTLFSKLLDALDTQKGLNTIEKRRDAILQQACKHAVKGGEKLPQDVIESLVEQMISGGVTPTCPHGRPLIIRFTKTDIEKRFKRIQ